MTSLRTLSARKTTAKTEPFTAGPNTESGADAHAAEARVTRLRARLEEAKRARAAAEAKREMALQRKKEIEDQIRAMGVEPENVEAEIERLEAEVEEKLAAAEELLRPFEELSRRAG